MIHRAPMTRKEMTEEDIKLRQGRSKQQYTSSSIGAAVSGYLTSSYFTWNNNF